MSEGAIGIVTLLAICGSTAAAAHLLMRRYFAASLISAVLSTAIFQFIAYLHVGYLDPFWPISIPASGALALVISLITGLIILANRKGPKTE